MYIMYIFRRGVMWVHKFATFKQMCVLSQTIYRTTFCALVHFGCVHFISETCMVTGCQIITIFKIIDVKHHSIIRDTGDEGYWRYRCTHSYPCAWGYRVVKTVSLLPFSGKNTSVTHKRS